MATKILDFVFEPSFKLAMAYAGLSAASCVLSNVLASESWNKAAAFFLCMMAATTVQAWPKKN